jgi:heme o synthase
MRKAEGMILSYLDLCKTKISFFSALSAAAGFSLTSAKLIPGILVLTAGVFLLACGSSSLNQYQERGTDALMERTKKRPIPSGRTTSFNALYFSIAMMIAGLFALYLTGGVSALFLGVFAVAWYNGVYTYLKRKTAFAVIPGAVVGAIPPAIGWVTGGGALLDPKLAILCFVFFMWQVPHFWVLLLNYGAEYEEAGLPSLSGIFSRIQLQRVASSWIFAMVASCFLTVLYGMVHSRLGALALVIASLWSVWQGIALSLAADVSERHNHLVFRRINYYMLFVMSLVSFDRLTYTLINMG